MDTSHSRVSALILLSTALISASFVPLLAGAAPALWTVALVVAVGAVCLAMRLRAPKARETPRPTSRRFRVLVLVVFLVVGALVGSVLVQAPGAHAAPAPGLGVTKTAGVNRLVIGPPAQLARVPVAPRHPGADAMIRATLNSTTLHTLRARDE